MVDGIKNNDLEIEELGDELDVVELGDFGDVDLSCDLPHYMFPTSELKDFLKVARNISKADGRDIISKSICLSRDGDELVLRSTDFDVYFEYRVELLNSTDVLNEDIILPIDIVLKLIKATPANTVIFKEGDSYYLKLFGGDMPVETYTVDVNKFVFDSEVELNTTISAPDLYSVIKGFGDIVTSAVSPMERRIICDKENAYASYMWVTIKAESPFANMDIKIKDIKVLRNLLSGVTDDLEVYSSIKTKIPRKVLKTDKFIYAFLISTLQVPESVKTNLDKVLLPDGIYVNFTELYKMVELASELPYATGKVLINYTDRGSLKLIIKTKSEKQSVFNIGGVISGEIKPLRKDLVLQAKLFKVLLKSFSDNSSIKLSLSKAGIGLFTDQFKASIYPESS